MQDFKLILLVAILWLAGGVMMAVGLHAYLDVDWLTPCASLSLIASMILLLAVMRDEQARHRLFGETDEDIPFKLSLAALLALPILFIVVGLIWLLVSLLLSN